MKLGSPTNAKSIKLTQDNHSNLVTTLKTHNALDIDYEGNSIFEGTGKIMKIYRPGNYKAYALLQYDGIPYQTYRVHVATLPKWSVGDRFKKGETLGSLCPTQKKLVGMHYRHEHWACIGKLPPGPIAYTDHSTKFYATGPVLRAKYMPNGKWDWNKWLDLHVGTPVDPCKVYKDQVKKLEAENTALKKENDSLKKAVIRLNELLNDAHDIIEKQGELLTSMADNSEELKSYAS